MLHARFVLRHSQNRSAAGPVQRGGAPSDGKQVVCAVSLFYDDLQQ